MEPSTTTTTTKKRPSDEHGTEEMRSRSNKSRRRGPYDDEDVDREQEKEIEEFFDILRRIHGALQYFHKPPQPESSAAVSWKPTFEPQDFEDLPDGNSGFDLNSEPSFKRSHPPA